MGTILCSKCSKTFDTYPELMRHLREDHKGHSKQYGFGDASFKKK